MNYTNLSHFFIILSGFSTIVGSYYMLKDKDRAAFWNLGLAILFALWSMRNTAWAIADLSGIRG